MKVLLLVKITLLTLNRVISQESYFTGNVVKNIAKIKCIHVWNCY